MDKFSPTRQNFPMDWKKGTPYRQPGQNFEQRPRVEEKILKGQIIQIERKTVSILLKENQRGQFLRITEEGAGRQNSIVIPSSGLAELKKIIDEMVEISGKSKQE
jgi:hypothetical protein